MGSPPTKKDNQAAGHSDYCAIDSPKESRLSNFERLTFVGGEDLDKALAAVSDQFSALSDRTKVEAIEPSEAQSAAEFYTQEIWSKDPDSFFVKPSELPKVQETFVHGLKDGEIVDLAFKSAYQVRNTASQADFEAVSENGTAHARLWRHGDGNIATIVAIHGWSMGDQRLNSLAFLPGVFYQLGYDVALVELPFHGRRKPKKSQAPLFPSTNLARTNEAMGQIISDLRELTLYLIGKATNEKPQARVGCLGMSLGAYVGALWAGLDNLDFCLPIVPVCNMAEMAWSILRNLPEIEQLKSQGLTPELLSRAYWIHSPLTHSLKVERSRLFIVAGIGDQVVPPRQPKLLWDHWGRPKMAWFGGGHAAQIKRREAFEEVIKFLQGLHQQRN